MAALPLLAVCREVGGISACVEFFQCCCAKMEGSMHPACLGIPSSWGVQEEQQMWNLSRARTLTWVNPLKGCNHKPVMVDGFLHLHHWCTELSLW